MSTNKQMADNLKYLRKFHNLTQDEVASIISKDRSSIAKYESAKAVPPFDILSSFSKLYKVTIDELCGIKAQNNSITLQSSLDEDADEKPIYPKLTKQEQLLILKLRTLDKSVAIDFMKNIDKANEKEND